MINPRNTAQKLRDEIQELTLQYEFLNKRLEPMERDAIRYQKLKALHLRDLSEWETLWKSNNFDSAVDALPDPNENPNRSR